MRAIRTKYHGPGNVRGSRVSASCGENTVTLSWDNTLSDGSEANHVQAALALCKRMGWDGTLSMGTLSKRGRVEGRVFVWGPSLKKLQGALSDASEASGMTDSPSITPELLEALGLVQVGPW